ncbi:MAG: hypothetical protein IJX75_04330 [Clostridia bacterium]|nr:hypothetical protein [Clostridia bacterium]
MRKKKILVIVLTSIIFVSVMMLGITSVYRIDEITLNSLVVSEIAKTESKELEERLLKAYDKDSYFSCDSKKAETLVKEYPYFRLTAFKKAGPNRLIIEIKEDAEMYAVPVLEQQNLYYILGADGVVLGIRETYINRFDGKDNLLIQGLNVNGEEGKTLTGDWVVHSLFTICNQASKLLNGIRRNITLIEVIRKASAEEETILKLTTREGVKIYVRNPASMPEEKAQKAIEKYLALSDFERLTGRIAVSDKGGEVLITYSDYDEFVS